MSVKHEEVIKTDNKCYVQKQNKDILEADMVSTPKGITETIPKSCSTSVPVKKHSVKKSLPQFSEVLNSKQETAVRTQVRCS